VAIGPRSRVHPGSGFRRQSGPPVNPLALLVILVVVFAIIIIGGVYLLSASAVTLIIDGTPQTVRTHQPTVSAMLTELQIGVEPQDIISPSGETPVSSGLLVKIDKAHAVMVDVDGQRRRILTQAIQPRDILTEARLDIGPHDLIRVDNAELKPEPYTTPPLSILVVRALPVQIDDNGATTTVYSVKRTVGEVLYDAKVALYLADLVTPDAAAPIGEKTTIIVRRSVPVTMVVDGRTLATRTHGKTVGEALAETGIALVGLDFVVPDASTPITKDLTIRVVRVSEEDVIIERTPIQFKQVTRPDPALALDTRQMIQPGVAGTLEQRIRVRREDGVEVSRSPVESVIVQVPSDEITAVGTLPTLKTLNTPDGPIQYWRVLKMRVASYSPSSAGRLADDPLYGITATGQKLHKGLVAIDPQVIPLGSRLFVPGYGTAVAADTGGAVQGMVIDLGYGDDDYQEWSGAVDVYLLPPVPPPDQIPIIPEEAK
jgi:resuscitation-promoting factor RpfB